VVRQTWNALLVVGVACSSGATRATSPATPATVTPAASTADAGAAPAPAPTTTSTPCNTIATCADQCSRAHTEVGCRRLGDLGLAYDVKTMPQEQLYATLRDACVAGVISSCMYQGAFDNLIVNGRRVPGVDRSGAAAERSALFERACNGGDPRGCDLLADLNDDDPARAKPLRAQAAALLDKRCATDAWDACDELARQLQRGAYEGDTPDTAMAERASRLFDRVAILMQAACDRGDAFACRDLADDYTNDGYAVTTDLDKSHELARRACALSAELCN
jgi:hypothetical protein